MKIDPEQVRNRNYTYIGSETIGRPPASKHYLAPSLSNIGQLPNVIELSD